MTIHKSKGLEFGNVIVCDALKKAPPKDNIIFDYESIEIKDIKLRFAIRDSVDNEYKKVIQKENDREKEDTKNLHYVAFTRAENSMFILKKEKNSSFDYLNLKEGKRGIFEVKNDNNNKEEQETPIKSNIKNYGIQEVAKKEKEYKANDYDAIYLGLSIHSLFETDDFDYVLNRYGEMCDVKMAYEMYQKAKENEEYKNLLNGELKRELPFKHKNELGFIDLAVFSDEIIIIDYKTTKPNDLSGYKSQVNRYKTAMSEIYNKPSKGYLYFIDSLDISEV
jgi:exodeoxyribonuclease V beta subunit